VENGRKALVYDFWAHDVATDIARKRLKASAYEVEIRRKLMDPSAPEGCKCYD